MDKKLTVYFTSDVHGYFSPVNYATGQRAETGLANCLSAFRKDGNTLIIDGGDMLQGSPLTYYLHKNKAHSSLIPAAVMNCGGYDFVTLGNHDFNYGPEHLQEYLDALDGVCLCANVEGLRGIRKTAVVTMENGLRVGLTGIVTHFVNLWERPENLEGLTVKEPIPCAKEALRQLREQNVDLTICIYHGGFENDLDTGRLLSDTGENQGYEICRDLNFDILLTGHQHIAMPGKRLFDTYICQTPDKAKQYIRLEAMVSGKTDAGNQVAAGFLTAEAKLMEPETHTNPEAAEILAPADAETAAWLDVPVGHLDTALQPKDPLTMAVEGSYIANFFNQVQLEASGADLSATSLANEVKGFNREVTVRDVVATYVYPNTLETLAVNRKVLVQALERSAEYYDFDEQGRLCISEAFLKPKVEHYNFDYISGLKVVLDLRQPKGKRVQSVKYQGEELAEDRELTICMNNYRSTGTGGYPFYAECKKVREQPTEIAEMIMDYVVSHGDIQVDKTQWVTILY